MPSFAATVLALPRRQQLEVYHASVREAIANGATRRQLMTFARWLRALRAQLRREAQDPGGDLVL